MRKAALLLAVAACADQSAPGPHDIREQSGSRLKIERWSWASGASFRGVFDSELGQECAFRVGDDGVVRCLPAVPTESLDRYVAATRDVQVADTVVVPVSLCTNDGFVMPIGFHDTARDVDCTPTRILAADFACQPATGPTADDPELAFGYDAASPRLATGTFATLDGRMHQHTADLYDSVAESECVFGTAMAPDRCIPASPIAPATAYSHAIATVDE